MILEKSFWALLFIINCIKKSGVEYGLKIKTTLEMMKKHPTIQYLFQFNRFGKTKHMTQKL